MKKQSSTCKYAPPIKVILAKAGIKPKRHVGKKRRKKSDYVDMSKLEVPVEEWLGIRDSMSRWIESNAPHHAVKGKYKRDGKWSRCKTRTSIRTVRG